MKMEMTPEEHARLHRRRGRQALGLLIAVLVLILAVCCATYKQSPMYINQNRYNEAMSYKQNDAERMIKRAEGNKDGTLSLIHI